VSPSLIIRDWVKKKNPTDAVGGFFIRSLRTERRTFRRAPRVRRCCEEFRLDMNNPPTASVGFCFLTRSLPREDRHARNRRPKVPSSKQHSMRCRKGVGLRCVTTVGLSALFQARSIPMKVAVDIYSLLLNQLRSELNWRGQSLTFQESRAEGL
jgi:hypothetical protein